MSCLCFRFVTCLTAVCNNSRPVFPGVNFRHTFILLLLMCCGVMCATENLSATGSIATNAAPCFNVTTYAVEGDLCLSTNVLGSVFAKYGGTNVSLDEIVQAAADLQAEYGEEGYPMESIAFARDQITNGVVTLNVFQAAVPQVLVSGVRYLTLTNAMEIALGMPPTHAAPTPSAPAPAAAEEISTRGPDGRVHVIPSKSGPRFEVEKYQITGNSVLLPETIGGILTNIDGAYGTNVSFEGIRTVVSELQGGYREHGYVTVSVGLPPQKLTNATVKIKVTEGRLADINVTGNRYFSSNNVMKSLPSLHPGTILNGPIFQAELNRANANQDRQIYPVIGPGPDPGTSDLTLKVKDQFPLHAKVEFNNQNSPGTPDQRVNASAVYNNLWQMDHSLGVQYSFSPQQFKEGDQWDFYDVPLVANYSGFYRLPLGGPAPIEDQVASAPGSFGYDEATRKFRLPPPSGQPELNVFGSRSTVDTGLTGTSVSLIEQIPGFLSISRQDFEQDLTVNQDVGARLSFPLPATADFQSGLSGGVDYKTYSLTTYKTNTFYFTITTFSPTGVPNFITATNNSPVPATYHFMDYLPLSARYDGSLHDALGLTTFGLGLSGNFWYDSYTTTSSAVTNTFVRGLQSLQSITGSTKSTGHWLTLTPSFSRTLVIDTNWTTTLRADGQWTTEPLISTEQYGLGGVNSVRGYHEGEVFGDNGWHVTLEQQLPPHVVGMVYGHVPLTIRGSIYMDYGTVYLLDPQGRPESTDLWGTGIGLAASVGSHWETRFLFSVPLISTSTTPRDQPYFNFSLIAQF
jgi:hemolysin activation/secretion protein